MGGWAFNSAAVDDVALIRLSARQFRKAFNAALRGEQNEFSRHMKRWNDRPPAHEWRDIRAYVFERDDYTCGYCGARGVKLECDHVVPVSRGGSNYVDNLKTACKPCNRAKGRKLLSEWVR